MAPLAAIGTVALIVAVTWLLQSFSEPHFTRVGDVECHEFCGGLPVMVRTAGVGDRMQNDVRKVRA